ncbi:MAG: hypothetical protein OXR73_28400 [Myxococcales bacterium]|nr:hypothetical protein [Myxococcales bacterium]
MRTNYIGLSCTGHDNAIAIVNSSGETVFAEATERVHQSKRALGLPPDDLHCIGEAVRTYCEPNADLVVAHTWSRQSRVMAARLFEHSRKRRTHLQGRRADRAKPLSPSAARALDFLDQRERTLQLLLRLHCQTAQLAGKNLRYRMGTDRQVSRYYDHHLTHAASASFASPFDEAVCIVVDGLGETGTTTCYHYRNGDLRQLQPAGAPVSAEVAGLGTYYADLCTLCGFDHWQGDEWKVMGLAASGKPDDRLHRYLGNILRVDGLRFRRPAAEPLAIARVLDWLAESTDQSAARATLAYEGQRWFERWLAMLCRNVHTLLPSDNLILTGGCALNSSANGKLQQLTPFKHVYIPPAPADDGNALGAAQLAFMQDNPSVPLPTNRLGPFLGSPIPPEAIEQLAAGGAFDVKEYTCFDGLCRELAEDLSGGAIVGWLQGRAEFGPRALGNRSILADPRCRTVRDAINASVKFREAFRPFGPAVLAEEADTYFSLVDEVPYMERAVPIRSEFRSLAPAVTQDDGTCRLQTVTQGSNARLHRLLRAFYEKTAVPMLLNTSFNVMGKPIVHSVRDAAAVFTCTSLSALVIGNHVFRKKS